ncbi:kinase-like domain-containing protein [Paraphysoderma sedebokerense]|nr:kinase-like domain-containing protein [Paraphysoderma sedebokerense]KAI9141075.1 kinase-like domain-containing protein [Paraphysoderma sedebokerense]
MSQSDRPRIRSPTLHSVSRENSHFATEKNFLGNTESVEKFEKLKKIGQGTYGVVYKAREKSTNRILALKKIRMENEQEGFPVPSVREISLLQTLRHPNIVQIEKVVVGDSLDKIYIVMEYCEYDLANYVDQQNLSFSPVQVKHLMQQLLNGMQYLHSRFIIHRDLKLANLLLTPDGILKIADFGLARKFSAPTRPLTPKVVTLWYRPPEILFGEKKYTTAADMWAAGCIFAEFILNKPLMPGKTEQQQVEMIVQLLGRPNNDIWPGWTNLPSAETFQLPDVTFPTLLQQIGHRKTSVLNLLSGMLKYDPNSRLSAQDALMSEYFTEAPLLSNSKDFFLPFESRYGDIESYQSNYRNRKQRQTEGVVTAEGFTGVMHDGSTSNQPPYNKQFSSGKGRGGYRHRKPGERGYGKNGSGANGRNKDGLKGVRGGFVGKKRV